MARITGWVMWANPSEQAAASPAAGFLGRFRSRGQGMFREKAELRLFLPALRPGGCLAGLPVGGQSQKLLVS
jgi:hypothetical protein